MGRKVVRGLNPDLDAKGLPIREGVYMVRGTFGINDRKWREEEVYDHPDKGLCIFNEYGGEDDDDCHTPVQFCGLTFGNRISDLS